MATSNELLLRFFRSEDDPLIPHRHEDVVCFSDNDLEWYHNFIQWIFPTWQPSGACPNAPTIDEHFAEQLCADKCALKNFCKSCQRYLNYMNIDCDGISHIVDSTRSELFYELPYHNYLRFTRMLDSLKVRLDSLENATAVITIISDGLENASKHYSIYAVADRIDALKGQGVMFVFMGTNQDVALTAASLHIDNYRVFEYTAEGMKEAWQSGIDASADYYERMSQYNKDTKGMSRQERNDYYRDRNKEDGWFK